MSLKALWLSWRGGKIIQCTPIVHAAGTTIEVKSLFYNVPVRKKFQKSPVYDTNEIHKVISNLALGNPSVKFQLISDQKVLLSTPNVLPDATVQEKLEARIQTILGSEFIEEGCTISGEHEGYQIYGIIGLPGLTRHNRTGQYLFVNRRAIVSPIVSYAVREGFGTMLSTQRYPVFVLHITLPGDGIDVNVHPQKREVRFRQEQILKTLVADAVKQALTHSKNGFQEFPSIHFPTFSHDITPPPISYSSYEYTPPIAKEEPRIWDHLESSVLNESPKSFAPAMRVQEELALYSISSLSKERISPKVLGTVAGYILIDSNSVSEDVPFKRISNGSGIGIVDVKGAFSRILFEKLSLGQSKAALQIQPLLVPQSLTLSHLETKALIDQIETLQKHGISIRQVGPNGFEIDAIPICFGDLDVHALVMELIKDAQGASSASIFQKEQEKRIALAATRASISRKLRLTEEEARSLLQQLFQCEMPYQCPLGRSTMALLSQEELAKKFI